MNVPRKIRETMKTALTLDRADDFEASPVSGMPVHLLVALSGGRDSVCLLHALKMMRQSGEPDELSFTLSAVHVNHQLRKTASRDEAFCRELCEKWGIPLTVRRVDPISLAKEQGLSLEDAARRLRYQVLKEEAEKQNSCYIVLAHHQKDQAETVLLHLLRGSGLKGLTGMSVVSAFPEQFRSSANAPKAQEGADTDFEEDILIRLLRPMLEVTEEELNDYVHENGLSFVEDETNEDLGYTRNRIRKELIPVLQSYNPKIVPSLSQMAAHLKEDEDFLQQVAEEALLDCRTLPDEKSTLPDCRTQTRDEEGLSCSRLLALPKALRTRVLQLYLSEAGLWQDLSSVHLSEIEGLLKGPSGRQIPLPKGLTLMKSYDILLIYPWLISQKPDITSPSPVACFLPEEEAIVFRAKMKEDIRQCWRPLDAREKWLSADTLTALPNWRKRLPGDYLLIRLKDGSLGKKSLQDVMVDDKIPLHLRDEVPLLCDGHHVLWIAGGRISEGAKLSGDTKKILYARF